MKSEIFKTAIEEITMPEQMKEALTEGCKSRSRTKNFRFRYSRAAAAAIMAAVCLLTVSMPAYAAYDLYQTKNLSVFFEYGIDEERTERLGETLASMEGIASVRFVSADNAWESFAGSYLTQELADSFDTNPLAESASYEVTVSLGADTKEIRAQILQLEGVRHLADRYEKKEKQAAAR